MRCGCHRAPPVASFAPSQVSGKPGEVHSLARRSSWFSQTWLTVDAVSEAQVANGFGAAQLGWERLASCTQATFPQGAAPKLAVMEFEGGTRNRTAVRGFAGRFVIFQINRIAHLPPRPSGLAPL